MNFNYHIHKSSIECPYCDKSLIDDDGEVAMSPEERIEFECIYCGKKFWADSCIVYNTYSDCKLNGEEHKFKASKSHPTVFNCENCYEYEVRSN